MVSLIEWSFQAPQFRSWIFRLRRWPLRMSRGFIAEAAIVVRSDDGRVLLLKQQSGKLHLPKLSLNGWRSIHLQVENLLKELLGQPVPISLVSPVGVVGDMTFLFRASVSAVPEAQADRCWLTAEVAATTLSAKDTRLLRLSRGP